MGDYNVWSNNCRDFVKKAMKVISNNKRRFDNRELVARIDQEEERGQEGIQNVQKEDLQKAVIVGAATGAVLAGGIYLLSKAFDSSNERRNRN